MNSALHILFVDDNRGDQELAREALAETGKGTEFHTASDGVEALEFLRRPANPRPHVVLLDLNMPRKDGIETLCAIREDIQLASLPVIIFSSSTAPSDKSRAELHKANGYIMKPLGLREFMQAIAQIEQQWCKPELSLNGALS